MKNESFPRAVSQPVKHALNVRRAALNALIALVLIGQAWAFAPALTPPDPTRAMNSFLEAYWDRDARYFLAWNRAAPFTRPSGAGPQGGKYADFWWAAQLWDLVMDAYERAPTPELRKLIGDVYDGFQAQYPDWLNDFNDDLGWWAQAAMRAYRITNDTRYLERAKTLFADIWTYWSEDYGGGVWWRRSIRAQKNVATNGPLTVIAVRLYQATRDETYLERARKLFAFVDARLTDGDARVWDNLENEVLRRWDFTYNFGNFVLAALALREVETNEAVRARLLERAVKSADWALGNLSNAGTLLDEGTGDGGGFRGVFLRALRRLADVADLDPEAKARFEGALSDNATQVWNQRRASDGLTWTDWNAPTGPGVIESMAAASGMAALQLARGTLDARVVVGDGRYEAENSPREGVSPSVAAPGYSGRGYINNFFKDGQFVRFHVNVAEAGRYEVRFRYSAGGGAVVRSVRIGEGSGARLEFPATSDWNTWAESSATLQLPAGPSAITVRFERASGSRGWLNLDRAVIVLAGAR